MQKLGSKVLAEDNLLNCMTHNVKEIYDVGESLNVRPTNNKKPNLENQCTILCKYAPILQNPY